MFKKNQKGVIDPVFIIVLVLVLLIGGFVYWRLNSAKEQPTQSTYTPTEQTQQQESEDKKPLDEYVVGSADDSTNTYTNKAPAFSFEYPEGWKVETSVENRKDYNSIFVTITSPDFAEKEDELCTNAGTGTEFVLSVSTKQATSLDERKAELESDSYFTGPRQVTETKMGDERAIQHMGSPGECGWSLRTDADHGEANYYLMSHLGDTEAGDEIAVYRAEYDLILKSFKFID